MYQHRLRLVRAIKIFQHSRLKKLMTVNPRITRISADSWIGFSEMVLRRLNALMEVPRQLRMSGLLV